jgi:hypothetical protein
MFDLIGISYLDDDGIVAKLNKHQLSDLMCHCYLCRECRGILAQRGLEHDDDVKNLNPPVDPDSGDI